MNPSEAELLILPNTEFKVKLALSCDQARLLNAGYAAIPDNVDLVILEAALPSTCHSHSRPHPPFLHRQSQDQPVTIEQV
jgi:hypothetical protein